MQKITDAWVPAESVLNHSGTPLVTGRNFFAPPPKEIGTVLSAYSALKVGKSPDPERKRLKITLGVVLAFVLLGYLAAAGSEPKNFGELIELGTMLGVIFGLVMGIITYLILYLFRRDYRCDYVGTEGVADYDLLELRRGKPGKVLRFQDATDLKITLTPQRIKGIQAATGYRYSWVDANNKEIFFLSGEYYTEQKAPEDKFHLATAAETAWWEYQRVLRAKSASETASYRGIR